MKASSTGALAGAAVHAACCGYCLSYEERHATAVWVITIQLLPQDRPAPLQEHICKFAYIQTEDNRNPLVQIQNHPVSNLPGLSMNISSDIIPGYPRVHCGYCWEVQVKKNTATAQGLHVPNFPLKAKEEHLSTVWVYTKVNINVQDSHWKLYYLNYWFVCYSESQVTEIKHYFSWYSLLKLQQ